jgi:hypothetical protein
MPPLFRWVRLWEFRLILDPGMIITRVMKSARTIVGMVILLSAGNAECGIIPDDRGAPPAALGGWSKEAQDAGVRPGDATADHVGQMARVPMVPSKRPPGKGPSPAGGASQSPRDFLIVLAPVTDGHTALAMEARWLGIFDALGKPVVPVACKAGWVVKVRQGDFPLTVSLRLPGYEEERRQIASGQFTSPIAFGKLMAIRGTATVALSAGSTRADYEEFQLHGVTAAGGGGSQLVRTVRSQELLGAPDHSLDCKLPVGHYRMEGKGTVFPNGMLPPLPEFDVRVGETVMVRMPPCLSAVYRADLKVPNQGKLGNRDGEALPLPREFQDYWQGCGDKQVRGLGDFLICHNSLRENPGGLSSDLECDRSMVALDFPGGSRPPLLSFYLFMHYKGQGGGVVFHSAVWDRIAVKCGAEGDALRIMASPAPVMFVKFVDQEECSSYEDYFSGRNSLRQEEFITLKQAVGEKDRCYQIEADLENQGKTLRITRLGISLIPEYWQAIEHRNAQARILLSQNAVFRPVVCPVKLIRAGE